MRNLRTTIAVVLILGAISGAAGMFGASVMSPTAHAVHHDQPCGDGPTCAPTAPVSCAVHCLSAIHWETDAVATASQRIVVNFAVAAMVAIAIALTTQRMRPSFARIHRDPRVLLATIKRE